MLGAIGFVMNQCYNGHVAKIKRAFQKATLYIENLIVKNLYTRSDVVKRVLALSKRMYFIKLL